MTLIAFATYGRKRAEFITDTAAYNAVADWTGRCTKHLTLNHIDAAVLNSGPLDFGHMFRGVLLEASPTFGTFDELVDGASELLVNLRQFWHENSPAGGRTGIYYQPTVALVGWSDRAEEFVGYVFAGTDDFEPTVPDGLWASTSAEPHRPTPARADDWRALALKARRDAADGVGFPVGGDVIHTRLERGSAISRRIHTYAETGEEFGRMVAGTAHPVALARPCYCGNGVPFGECHITDLLAKPCYCESDKTFGECCYGRADALALAGHAVT